MDEQSMRILDFTRIREMLADEALSNLGRELALALEPKPRASSAAQAMLETTEARDVLDAGAQVPLWGLADARPAVDRAAKGGVLQPAELLRLADCMRGCSELRRYMHSKRAKAPTLLQYAERIVPLDDLTGEIYASIDGARVADAASPRLARVRKEIRIIEDRIKAKMQSYLTSAAYREVLQEGLITMRGDHYALPVKASQRHRISGTVVDSSGSGMTVFIEPEAVRKMTDDLRVLRGQEEAEEYQVLTGLSGFVADHEAAISGNLEVVAFFDFTFAKARLSIRMRGRAVELRETGAVQLLGARHPLIEGEVVPLDLVIGQRYRTLVITGPNTGGKTVALKTVGLLALMAQSGLHLPVDEGAAMPIFDHVLADIGDAQSIAQSLSTFSGHVSRIAAIIRLATRASLVLLDEIGTGTDPAEGAALAMAILEDLHAYGCITIASTHYGDVKRLAEQHPGFINGRMDFDPETLQPLYRLVIGEAGESQALSIAARLGLERRVLDRAKRWLTDESLSSVRSESHRSAGRVKSPEKPLPAASADLAVKTASNVAVPEGGRSVEAEAPSKPAKRPWRLGDSVMLPDGDQQGVIAVLPDEAGQVVVFSRGRRVTVPERRLRLLVGAEHLYPDGYDLRTVLFSWQDRKTMHQLQRGKTEILGTSGGQAWVKTGEIGVDRREEPVEQDPDRASQEPR